MSTYVIAWRVNGKVYEEKRTSWKTVVKRYQQLRDGGYDPSVHEISGIDTIDTMEQVQNENIRRNKVEETGD